MSNQPNKKQKFSALLGTGVNPLSLPSNQSASSFPFPLPSGESRIGEGAPLSSSREGDRRGSASQKGNEKQALSSPLSEGKGASLLKGAAINKGNNNKQPNKQEVVSITYEEIGLFPRSFSRVLDRFFKQVFSDVENLVIQEYRFYRYLFLTTLKCVLILFFVPFFVNFLAKTYIVRPLTEYFWNTKQTEIFLNSYQQKRAFAELKEFEEKTYFESLIFPKSVLPSTVNGGWAPPMEDLALQNPTVSGLTPHQKHVEHVEHADEQSLSRIPPPYSFVPPQTLSSLIPFSFPSSSEERDKMQAPLGLGVKEGDTVEWATSPGDKGATFSAAPVGLVGDKKNSVIAKPSEGITLREEKNDADALEGKVTSHIAVGGNNSLNLEQGKQPKMNLYTMKSSLFVYQTQEADKNIQQRYQEKTIELAQTYNNQSIEAITNFFADLMSLCTLFYLLYALEIQINITKSFLLEVFFGLDDSKKSLLILLITDLLVGYHSSNLWELFFEFLFHHYGLPESQTGIFLLVATLPVLLDVLFKYLIFRHLNRSSPATVATYHAMIE